MIVELHILQNFAPSCLNRDDTNSPKECDFGGSRRARISSQCIKRATREYFKEANLISDEQLAVRTKAIVTELARRLKTDGKPEEEARLASIGALKAIKLGVKDNDKTEYLLFTGEGEIKSLSETILKHWDGLLSAGKDDKKEPDKAIGKELLGNLDGGKAVDLALFGRMLANLPDKNIDAACQVAHAISTNKVGVEFDFYTAVDDLQPKEETGAGMMGTVEFNSACYYRYANIDVDQLKKNLSGDEKLAQKTIEAFLRASVNAVPSGKQTSFAAQNPPDFIFAVVRENGAWSLANAFSKPISVNAGGDLTADSIKALAGYWAKLNKAYGAKTIRAKPAVSLMDGVELNGMDEVENFEELVKKVSKAVGGDC